MNMIKKNGGFTLVELIVVIAILAILAGIAVPAYSGYIKKANEAADYTALDAIKTAAVFAATENAPTEGVAGITVNVSSGALGSVVVDYSGTTADYTLTADDISDYVGTVTFKAVTTKAVWSSTGTNANKWILDPAA